MTWLKSCPDRVDVQNPLGDQRFTLSANPAVILFFGRWRPHHRANPWLCMPSTCGSAPRHQFDRSLPVGVGATPQTTRHRQRDSRSSLHDAESADPEPVKPRFLDDHKRIELPQSCLCPHPQISEDGEAEYHRPRSKGGGHLVASRSERRRQRGLFTQFQRNENYAKIDTDSGRRLRFN